LIKSILNYGQSECLTNIVGLITLKHSLVHVRFLSVISKSVTVVLLIIIIIILKMIRTFLISHHRCKANTKTLVVHNA